MKKIDVGRIFGGLYCILFIGIGYGLTFLSKIEGLEKAELIFSIVIAFWVFMALFEIQAILNRNAKLRKTSGKDIEQGPFPYIDSIELLVLGISLIAILLMHGKKEILLLSVIASYISDVCGYVFGKHFGKKKVKALARISPKKSYVGYAGAIFVPIIPLYLIGTKLLGIEPSIFMIIGYCLAGVVAAIGDLLGSATKRELDVKDSGEELSKFKVFKILEAPLINGHGGYLDRMDSIMPVTILFTVCQLLTVWVSL